MKEARDRAVLLLQRVSELLLESRAIVKELEVVPVGESSADTADRIAYGILVAALEEGLVTTIRHALDVLKRFSRPAGVLGNSGSASRKDAWASANRVPRGVTISLFGRPDDRNHPHPLALIRHRDQLLPMLASFDVASHPKEWPPDLAERIVAIPSDRNLTAAPRPGIWSGLRALAVLIEPDRRHGARS
jgi:hypothetical protein